MKRNLNMEISDRIITDFIYQKDLFKGSELLGNLETLKDNGVAVCISGSDDVSFDGLSKYKLASKFITKYNKDLKNHRRILLEYEFGNKQRQFVDDSAELRKLAKCGLEKGIYCAEVETKKGSNYIVLNVDYDKRDSYLINYQLYIVGDDHLKIKDKFFKLYDKYEALSEKNSREKISYSDNKPSKVTPFKPFSQVVFNEKDKILKYIDNWVSNIPQYYQYGMTPKLSILLHGEPGTGKSTFAKALAKYLNIDTVFSIAPSYFFDDMHNEGPKKRMISMEHVQVIDDIDCVCKSRDQSDEKDNTIILSNLLSYLDNPNTFYYKAKDGIYYPIAIVVATTNYYDKLDPAVKRYGRFDLKIEMTNFSIKEAKEMCDIYDLRLEDVITDPIDEKEFVISPAYLQAKCLENIDKSLKNI